MFQGHGLWAHPVCHTKGQIYSFAGYGSFKILIRLFQKNLKINSLH